MTKKTPTSVICCTALCFTVLAGLAVLCGFLPMLLRMYFARMNRVAGFYLPSLLLIYCIFAVAIIAVVAVLVLMQRVSLRKVLSQDTERTLLLLALLCFVEAGLCTALGFYLLLAYAAAVGGVFLGSILLVLRSVFREAVCIKEENDYTI